MQNEASWRSLKQAFFLFSLVSGAVSFLSAFSPSVPIDWSATMHNLLVGYHVIVRDPISSALLAADIRLPHLAVDQIVFYTVFVLPTLWQTLVLSVRDTAVGSVVIFAALLMMFVIWLVLNFNTLLLPEGRTALFGAIQQPGILSQMSWAAGAFVGLMVLAWILFVIEGSGEVGFLGLVGALAVLVALVSLVYAGLLVLQVSFAGFQGSLKAGGVASTLAGNTAFLIVAAGAFLFVLPALAAYLISRRVNGGAESDKSEEGGQAAAVVQTDYLELAQTVVRRAYARSLLVVVLIGALLLANRVLIGYGY